MNPSIPNEISGLEQGDVVVRKATQHDAESIAAIYNHYVDAGGATFDTEHWSLDHVSELIENPVPEGWFIAAAKRDVIGWGSVRPYSLRHGYRFTCETALYLNPSAMGHGVGDQLQQRLEAHCRACEIHHAVARIVADNQRSMRFHYHHGYELVGIQKEVGHMNGRWTDVAILQKIF